MKKTMLMSAIVAAAMLSGCGSSTTNKTYVEEAPAPPEIPLVDGQVLVVSGNEGDTGISYTNLGDGSLLIDCGDGGCGDITVASEIIENVESEEDNATSK